jgi:hypothetical protein
MLKDKLQFLQMINLVFKNHIFINYVSKLLFFSSANFKTFKKKYIDTKRKKNSHLKTNLWLNLYSL